MIEIRHLKAEQRVRRTPSSSRKPSGDSTILTCSPCDSLRPPPARSAATPLAPTMATAWSAFCVAIPGIKKGAKSYLHSHMLGVMKEYRDAGLGRKLKLAQRDDAIRQGLDLIEWTFDPLEIKNAFFNIERLGAIVRRFVLNQYGVTSSPLNAGLPTDRCYAEWWLESDRVNTLLAGGQPKPQPIVARISITNDIYQIKANDFTRAREIQLRVADQFLENFSNNLAVTGFERSAENGTYLFSPWPSE